MRTLLLHLVCLASTGTACRAQFFRDSYGSGEGLLPSKGPQKLQHPEVPVDVLARLLLAFNPSAAFLPPMAAQISSQVPVRQRNLGMQMTAHGGERMQAAAPVREKKKLKLSEPVREREQQATDYEWHLDEEWRAEAKTWHILLLGCTFSKPKMTPMYVAGCLTYVLSMLDVEALEHAEFAKDNGFSVLGVWPRERALGFASKLKGMDLDVRVVPGLHGKQPWQKE